MAIITACHTVTSTTRFAVLRMLPVKKLYRRPKEREQGFTWSDTEMASSRAKRSGYRLHSGMDPEERTSILTKNIEEVERLRVQIIQDLEEVQDIKHLKQIKVITRRLGEFEKRKGTAGNDRA